LEGNISIMTEVIRLITEAMQGQPTQLTDEENGTGIKAEAPEFSFFEEGTKLIAEIKSNITIAGKTVWATYEIHFEKNGAEVSLADLRLTKVKIQIPIPEGTDIDPSRLGVYRIEIDGTLTNMNAYVENGCLVFETDHFSTYVVAQENGITPPASYTVTVNSGTGSGSYSAGAVVSISANAAPSGQVFDKWTVSGSGTVANANSASTTFTMGSGAATVTATSKAAPPTAPAITSANSYTCTVGAGGSFALAATGTAPVTWSLSGSVPAGVTVSGSTLNVAGSVAAGTYSFTVNAANGTLPNAAQAFTLTVNAAAATADKTALNDRLAAIGGTQKGDYTDASWDAFQSALTTARNVANNASATQAQVNDALNALNTAYGNLQLKKMIFTTKYEATFLNWILCFVCFGWVWMWFV
jgi:hypothetical protein